MTVLEGIAPCGAVAHICLTFLKVHELQTAVYDTADCEVIVILRVVKSGSRSILEHQLAGSGVLLSGALKVDVCPLAVLLILHLACHGVLLSFDAKASCHVHEEDVARAIVSHLSLHCSDRSLCYLERLFVRVETDVLIYPQYQLVRIVAELLLQLGVNVLLEVVLEGDGDHLVLHARRNLIGLSREVVFQNLFRNVSEVLV